MIVVVLMVVAIRSYQGFFLYRSNRIRYEEEPEPIMTGLDYQPPPHKKSGHRTRWK